MVLKIVNEKNHFYFDRDALIGEGGFGNVYRGNFLDQSVAVKHIPLTNIKGVLDSREETFLTQLQHANIVKLFHIENDDDFKYIVLELCCAENLRDYCNEKYNGPPIPSDLDVLLQLTDGLDYIHSKDVIHRDIKPENILFSKTKPVVMKWADFGLSKWTNSRGSASLSGVRGTSCWVPKEIIPSLRLRNYTGGRCSKQGDIFSTGCVFFFFLTRGVHPFGNENDVNNIESNILKGAIVNQGSLDDGHFEKGVVIEMIKDRIELSKVIEGLLTFKAIIGDQPKPIPTKCSLIPTESSAVLSRNVLQENIIPIADLLQGKRKKSGWAIKARVIEGPSISYKENFPGVPLMKQLVVKLQDENRGEITARACYSKIVNKFHKKIFQGKEYLIKNAKVGKNGTEKILILNGKTELTMI